MRRFTAARQRQLRELGRSLDPPQPNRGRHDCTGCGLAFSSEAGFAFHRRTLGPRVGARCLTAKQLRRFRFVGGRTWKAPAWVELWYVDEIEMEMKTAGAGFTKEAWLR